MPENSVNSPMINVMLFSCSFAANTPLEAGGESVCDCETESPEKQTQIMLTVTE